MSLYTPDRKIEKMLTDHDPCLRILWNPSLDKWQVWRFPENGRAYHVKTVCNDDRSFRPLDERLVAHIKSMDTWKRTVDDIVADVDSFNSEVKRDLLNKRDSAIRQSIGDKWGYIKQLREQMGTITMSKAERIQADRALEERLHRLDNE